MNSGQRLSYETVCFDAEKKALTLLYYLDCLGGYFL